MQRARGVLREQRGRDAGPAARARGRGRRARSCSRRRPRSTAIRSTRRSTRRTRPGGQRLRRDRSCWSSTSLAWLARLGRLRYAALRYFNAAGAVEGRAERHDPETHLIPIALAVAAGERDVARPVRRRLPDARRDVHPRLRPRRGPRERARAGVDALDAPRRARLQPRHAAPARATPRSSRRCGRTGAEVPRPHGAASARGTPPSSWRRNDARARGRSAGRPARSSLRRRSCATRGRQPRDDDPTPSGRGPRRSGRTISSADGALAAATPGRRPRTTTAGTPVALPITRSAAAASSSATQTSVASRIRAHGVGGAAEVDDAPRRPRSRSPRRPRRAATHARRCPR